MTDTQTWNEDNSQTFIDYGRYFVPQRETQIEIICDAIPVQDAPFVVIELACGEGLLAEALLTRFPQATVHGYDLSPQMLATAAQRLARFGDRFQTRQFDLIDTDWRAPSFTPHAVVSSLTIHHLDGAGKARLFADVCNMLADGGAFVFADVLLPANKLANEIAAKGWDTAVRHRAQTFDGNDDAYNQFLELQWNLHRYPEDPETGIDKPSTLLEQLNWLAQAGFAGVDALWLEAGHAILMGLRQSRP